MDFKLIDDDVQIKTLRRMFGAHRFVYNQLVSHHNSNGFNGVDTNDKSLMDDIVTAGNTVEWINEVPDCVVASATDAFLRDVKNEKMAYRKKNRPSDNYMDIVYHGKDREVSTIFQNLDGLEGVEYALIMFRCETQFVYKYAIRDDSRAF